MSVFTIQTLLGSVGVSRDRATPEAIAINWILKLRFVGDILMELASVLKNVVVVTSISTRTPIYKAFAKGGNIWDVTAKGECVGNNADLVSL
ncbi:hypothetical protein RYX36_001868 [Vicia faba]